MLAVFSKPSTPKHLYFNLNNAFHLANPPFSSTYKVAGIYAIYKNNICYYVGQSKNIPSRLSNHLTGKYSVADTVHVYFIGDSNYQSFYENSKDGQKEILEINESWAINRLRPIENLLINSDPINQEYLCDTFTDSDDDDLYPCVKLFVGDHNITVADNDTESVFSVARHLLDEYCEHRADIEKYMEATNESN